MSYKTEQENFWSGDFGECYIERNKDKGLLASNIAFFSKIFAHTKDINSCIEFGANIGMNLMAIDLLLPHISKLGAIEINEKAATILNQNLPKTRTHNCSILEYTVEETYDFVLSKGVLIHIAPEELKDVYEKMYTSSSKYICIAEYYNPTPVSISYRGFEDRLFKRDFAGEMLDTYSDLELVDYGFSYHRDNNFKSDDITWFLLRKVDKNGNKNL